MSIKDHCDALAGKIAELVSTGQTERLPEITDALKALTQYYTAAHKHKDDAPDAKSGFGAFAAAIKEADNGTRIRDRRERTGQNA